MGCVSEDNLWSIINGTLWVLIKIRYPNNWMVNTKTRLQYVVNLVFFWTYSHMVNSVYILTQTCVLYYFFVWYCICIYIWLYICVCVCWMWSLWKPMYCIICNITKYMHIHMIWYYCMCVCTNTMSHMLVICIYTQRVSISPTTSIHWSSVNCKNKVL